MGKIFSHLSRFPKNDEFRMHDQGRYKGDMDARTAMQAEAINQHGVPVWYYEVSYDKQYDPLFGEDCDQRVLRKTRLNVQCELPKKEESWTQFGIEGLDNFSMALSIRHFLAVFSKIDPTKQQPEVGDFFQFVYDKRMFEVVSVNTHGDTSFNKTAITFDIQVKVWEDDQTKDGLGLIDDSIKHMEGSSFEVYDEDILLNVDGLADDPSETPPTEWSETGGKGHSRTRFDPSDTESAPSDPFGGF